MTVVFLMTQIDVIYFFMSLKFVLVPESRAFLHRCCKKALTLGKKSSKF